MAKLIHLLCFIVLAVFIGSALTAPPKPQFDDRGRYNPYHHNPYLNRNFYRNRDYYHNREYYDQYFKHYNPNVPAAEARIIEQENELSPEGTYSYRYETENGIHGEETGTPVRISADEQIEKVQGSFSFLTPEGIRVGVRYTADENGYHPIITYDGPDAEHYANLQPSADVVLTRIN